MLAICNLVSPNFFLGLRVEGAPETAPSAASLRRELGRWLETLDVEAIRQLYVEERYKDVRVGAAAIRVERALLPGSKPLTADLLKANGVARKNRKNLPSGRMLHGKLVTDTGRFYTPTHSSKGGCRYFYYTLVSKHADTSSRVISRLPAAEIEDRVISTIKSFIADPLRIADTFSSIDIKETKLLISAARHRAALLDENNEKNRSALISRAVFRIVVAASELRIELDRKHLCSELTDSRVSSDDSATIILKVPYEIARRGNEVRLILSDESSPIQGPIPSIVRAVA